MKLSRWALAALIASLVGPISGCDRAGDITEPDNGETASLSRIQAEIFDPNCVACHRSGGAGSLNLGSASESFANLVGVAAAHPEASGLVRVVPNDPDASFLVMKLEGGPGLVGERMPFGGQRLPAQQIQMVRDWISGGAPNN